jgi:hypothetical protein
MVSVPFPKTIYFDFLTYNKNVLNSILVLFSYALGAEEIRPHHRAGYPKMKVKINNTQIKRDAFMAHNTTTTFI